MLDKQSSIESQSCRHFTAPTDKTASAAVAAAWNRTPLKGIHGELVVLHATVFHQLDWDIVLTLASTVLTLRISTKITFATFGVVGGGTTTMGTSQLADNATCGKPTHEVTGAPRELTPTRKKR